MAPSAITTTETYAPLNFQHNTHWQNYPAVSKQHGSELGGTKSPKDLIGEALENRVKNIDQDVCEPGEEDAFYVADLGEVYRQHLRWKKNLKRVKPFYGTFRDYLV